MAILACPLLSSLAAPGFPRPFADTCTYRSFANSFPQRLSHKLWVVHFCVSWSHNLCSRTKTIALSWGRDTNHLSFCRKLKSKDPRWPYKVTKYCDSFLSGQESSAFCVWTMCFWYLDAWGLMTLERVIHFLEIAHACWPNPEPHPDHLLISERMPTHSSMWLWQDLTPFPLPC